MVRRTAVPSPHRACGIAALLFVVAVTGMAATPESGAVTPQTLPLLSIKDFRLFTREQGIRIVRHFYLGKWGRVRFWPNLRAGYGVFIVQNVPGRAVDGAVE